MPPEPPANPDRASGAAVLDELAARGQLAQTTDLPALRRALDAGPVTVYAGFDPTADSLHVGNLAVIMLLRRFQHAGHRVIALVGGATGLVGDPSGRSTERSLHDRGTVAEFKQRQAAQLRRFLDLDEPRGLLADNLDWTDGLPVLQFLRDVGKHFTVNTMLDKESVSARLATGLSFTEFSYMLLQAMDFLELRRRHGCVLQVGGSDQWGNITAGLDLIRRVDGVGAHGLTCPLVTNADGAKFGKTEGGAVWLDPAKTSPFAFYQYWLNVDDRDVLTHLHRFTDLPAAAIDALAQAHRERPGDRTPHRTLARTLTTWVHGAETVTDVEAASAALFGKGDLRAVPADTLAAAMATSPVVTLPPGPAPTLAELFVRGGLVDSRSAARRVASEGGAYLNNTKLTDVLLTAPEPEWLHGRYLVLRRGRQHVAGVVRGTGPAPS